MMTFKKNTLIFILLSVMVFSCDQAKKKETKDGAEYTLLSSEDGEPYVEGDYGIFYLKLITAGDSVLIDSKEVGMLPIQIDSASLSKRGLLFSILADMRVGDSIKSELNAGEVYSKGFKQPLGPDMQVTDKITIIASAKEKLDSIGFEGWKTKMREEMIAKMEAEAAIQREENVEKIQAYITENNLTVDSTDSGLLYAIVEEGTGSKPEVGQTVKVNYTGMLLNGKVFDTSVPENAKEAGLFNPERTYEPIAFPLGQGRVIKGWDEGIALLPVGTKAILVIPSDLAYGPRGAGADIPPNAPLVFEVELVAAE